MKSHRKERVARVIREIVSQAIAHQLNDPRVDPLTTVTRVEMVGDLEIARVYITVSGSDSAERRTLQAIQHAGGFLQRIVAAELVMRQTPRVEFRIDPAVRVARETMSLIDENRRRNPSLFEENLPDAGDDADDSAEAPSAEGGSPSIQSDAGERSSEGGA